MAWYFLLCRRYFVIRRLTRHYSAELHICQRVVPYKKFIAKEIIITNAPCRHNFFLCRERRTIESDLWYGKEYLNIAYVLPQIQNLRLFNWIPNYSNKWARLKSTIFLVKWFFKVLQNCFSAECFWNKLLASVPVLDSVLLYQFFQFYYFSLPYS